MPLRVCFLPKAAGLLRNKKSCGDLKPTGDSKAASTAVNLQNGAVDLKAMSTTLVFGSCLSLKRP